MNVLDPSDENDAEVRREDQDNINRFAHLNRRLTELRQTQAILQTELQTLDDASTELMMQNAGTVLLQLGGCFVECSEEIATEHCETAVEKLQVRLDALSEEEGDLVREHGEIKRVLYARFGKSIQLED